MRALWLVGIGLYLAYLVHVGFLMVALPWSDVWPHLLLQLPPGLAIVLDQPLVRGLISGFGVLHLLLALAEANPARFERRLRSPRHTPARTQAASTRDHGYPESRPLGLKGTRDDRRPG